ncbi:MAG: MFS transporter [Chloroflexi bacterium]|nr:MFS transporter [Chloroflexota bacterium]
MPAHLSNRLPATRHRDFRALWGGTTCSSISLWTLLLGNAWIVFKLSDSSFWVGVSTFASMSPFLLAPFGGVVADRFERRLLVRLTRLGALTTTLCLFALASLGVLDVWMVVGIAFVQGIVRAIEIPADQALLANVVPLEDLSNAVSLTTMTQQGSRAVGPLLSGPLLATVGVQGAYAIAALFALLAFISMSNVQTSSRGGITRVGQVVANLGQGLAYIRGSRPVLLIFLLVTAHCSLTMSFDAMLPGFAETQLHLPSGGFTTITFGVGMGALVGTFALALFAGGRRGNLLLWMGLASGVAPILMSASSSIAPAAVSSVLMGSSQAMFMALTAVLLQAVVPDDVRGRVMSLYLMAAGGIMAFANLGFGSLADAWGAPALFLTPGAAFATLVLVTRLSGTNLRAVYRTGVVPARAGRWS